jgi:hypothetical protein
MAQEFKIGRLRFTWSGAWTPATIYAKDSVVSYQGKTYACVTANTSNATSFYTDLNAGFWSLILDGKSFLGNWATTTFYSLGNIVIYEGIVYYCTTPHTSTTFASQSSNWSIYTQGVVVRQTWQSNTVYGINDIVTYGGIVYKCIASHTSAGTIVATNLSSNGTVATVTFSSQAVQPYAVGSSVVITGFSPTTLNGTFTVVSCTTTQLTFNTPITGIFSGTGTISGTSLLGLEANQSSWAILDNGIAYTGVWTANTRYKVNDIVKVNGNLYSCTTYHISAASFSLTNWAIFIPDEQFLGLFSSLTSYQIGDVIQYGGNTYVSNAANNLGNIPSTDAVNWSLLTPGATTPVDWNSTTVYYIGNTVRRNGRLYQAILDNNLTGSAPQDPVVGGATTYNSSGSSGTTLVVASTANVGIGSIVFGVGFTLGQTIVSVTNPTTVVLSAAPDGTPTNGQTINFSAVNATYWKLLAPSNSFAGKWNSGQTYQPGDTVIYGNRTYSCINQNTASSLNRPDVDVATGAPSNWIVLIDHYRKNASSNIGDITTYNNNTYTAVAIGTSGYILRDTGTLPVWSELNTVPNVLYVSTITGTDAPGFGNSLDRPLKTIAYAANIVANGLYNPNATNLLLQNKNWIITELLSWTQYQINNNLSGFTTAYSFNSLKTARDTGYILDALIYDLSRGGNSQTVSTTLAYFAYGSTNTFFNSAVTADIPYYLPIFGYLSSLITNAISQTVPASNYQTLDGVASTFQQYQITTGTAAEAGASSTVTTLLNYLIYALTNSTTTLLPTPNQGKSATIYVKTGTYLESLPIVIPANCAIVGDDLRSVTILPRVSITSTVTSSNGTTNLINVTSVTSATGVTISDSIPVQFIPSTTAIPGATITVVGGLTAGQTYYINGNTISGNSFGLVTSPTTTFTGTTTNGSTTITDVSSTNNLAVGNSISGSSIPGGATIISITPASSPSYNTAFNTITISAPATASNYNVTFTSIGAQVPVTTSTVSCTMVAGDQIKNMFLMRNATGLRNVTVAGLVGTYLAQDAFTVQRPSGGAYASLDPGLGPNDSKVWIINRSPYAQNCTMFGYGCVGMKIDGTLHNNGNKSMVANDFTQVLSDGIGVWCTGPGALTECISVFSYYGYTAYFAEAGGRIRAANGNSSYGYYGVISEGFDLTETPISGVVYNQSLQSQASVQSSLGTNAQLVKINYSNSGSNYLTPTTNLLQYSNNFLGNSWVNDGNITFNKVFTAPTGNVEAWTMIGTSSPGTAFLYQNVTISAKGSVYTGVSISTSTGVGVGATATVTVSATGYSLSNISGGSGYQPGDQLYIAGLVLGGKTPANNCLITVNTVSGSSVASVVVAGTVPPGSAFPYTVSIWAYQGTATQLDIQAIFSGSATMTSALNYNFATGLATPSSTGNGYAPTQYGAQIGSSAGWYRIWFSFYDASGLNTNLQIRLYPKGFNGAAGTYNYFYGSQLEQSRLPVTVPTPTAWTASTSVVSGTYLGYRGNVYLVTSPGITTLGGPTFNIGSATDGTATESYIGSYAPGFYLETLATQFTTYANYNIVGAGTGAVLLGDEIRSNSVFQTVVYTGGSGYLTASNNAQGGTNQYVTLSTSDINTAGNYTNMRIFINSGTGAGQYGQIGYYNASLKQAIVLREDFVPAPVVATAATTGYITLGPTTPTNNLYINMPVLFTPTYYSTTVTSTVLSQYTATQTLGGTVNQITISSTLGLTINLPVTFTGTTFGGIAGNYVYYISAIVNSTTIQITATLFGNAAQLNSATGSMNMNFSAANGYLQGSTTNMVPNYPIQFTGSALGGITVGQTYYICDIIDTNNFTISNSISTINITATNTTYTPGSITYNNVIVANSTATLVSLNPIIFSAPVISGSGLQDTTEYWISSIIDANNFTVASSIIQQQVIATNGLTNQITCASASPGTAGFVVGQPIIFAGSALGGLFPETVYYILTVNTPTTFTVSQSIGGGAYGVSTATGTMIARTCPASVTLSNTTGTMTATSTSKKLALSLGIGSMNGQFSTSLFGGITAGQIYYINNIVTPGAGGVIQISTQTTTNGGTPITTWLAKTGSITMTQVGFDHVTPGTPILQSLDSSTLYFIEPRLGFTAPGSYQSAASTTITLTGGAIWNATAYGAGTWIAVPSGGNISAISTDGLNWSSATLPLSTTYSCITYGNGFFVALSSTSQTGLYSENSGVGWRTFTMPANVPWSSIAYSNGVYVAIASGYNTAAYTRNFTRGTTSFTSSTLPSSSAWTNLAVGNTSVAGVSTTIFITLANGGNTAAYSINGGQTWLTSNLPNTSSWSSVAWGNGRFVAISSTAGTSPIYSFDGINWLTSPLIATGSTLIYGQGVFLALTSGSTTAYSSFSGLDWAVRTVTNDLYTSGAFGYNSSGNGLFVTLSQAGTGSAISLGSKTKGRPSIVSNTLASISLFEPGSGYTTGVNGSIALPTVTLTDPNVTSLSTQTPRVSNGTLANPSFYSKGLGYNTTTTTVAVTGNGFADTFQTGYSIILNNITTLPSPGANLTIAGNSTVYKVTSATAVFGTTAPNLEVNVAISPSISITQSAGNGTAVQIRVKYSQCRLTNHDFLNIGFGDQTESNYPLQIPQPNYGSFLNNQTIEVNYGRVFFTSTDQDGNFKVGNLFGVQQATGIITLSASQFGLAGLNTLSLGGIALGSASVVISQFSTDSSFTANSDTVVPTQRAVRSFLASRLSQGGANTFTGQITAGTVVIGGPNYIRSTIPNGQAGSSINMLSKVYINANGVDGNMMALHYFIRWGAHRTFS